MYLAGIQYKFIPRRVGGLLGVAGRLSGTVSPFRAAENGRADFIWATAIGEKDFGTAQRQIEQSNWLCVASSQGDRVRA